MNSLNVKKDLRFVFIKLKAQSQAEGVKTTRMASRFGFVARPTRRLSSANWR